MNSTLTKLAAAAAVSMAFAAPASAAIGTGNSAELFFEVYYNNGANSRTYILDLNTALSAFGTQNRATGGFTNIVDNSPTDATSWNISSDANWTTFMSGVTDTSLLRWDVVAFDGTGSGNPDTLRTVFTSSTNVVTALSAGGVQLPNAAFSTMAAVNTHIGAVNTALGLTGTSVVSTSTADPFSRFNNKGNNLALGLGALAVTDATPGSTMGFYYMTRSSGSANSDEVLASRYQDGLTTYDFTFAGDFSTLQYGPSAVAAIPEPGTWAMFLAGALMLGGIARRRMS